MSDRPSLQRANLLGQLAAEDDYDMLSQAFYETLNYKTLIEGGDAPVVVGRRGTGKSALTYRLSSHWKETPRSLIVVVSPEEDQVIGIRPMLGLFGESYRLIRAAMRIAWRYALLMEVAKQLVNDYKIKPSQYSSRLKAILHDWQAHPVKDSAVTARLRATLKATISPTGLPEERVGDLTAKLGITALEHLITQALDESETRCLILVDNLDEGYEPDFAGAGLIAGLIRGTIDLNNRIPRTRSVVFVRDNIFRGFAKSDPDFSRDIEGRFLRLHWEESELFYMVCKRLRIAFALDVENNTKLWNTCTGDTLHNMTGFRKCLRLTLYRPRDLLALLNKAYFRAAKDNRCEIVEQDVAACAKEISETRLDDLYKEYSVVVPGLHHYISPFVGGSAQVSLSEARTLMSKVLSTDVDDPLIRGDFNIHGTPDEVINTLHGIGFLGARIPATGQFAFSHDGRASWNGLAANDKLLIHPCYWLALNLSGHEWEKDDAEEIHDEYDIKVVSKSPEVRNKVLGALMAEIGTIPSGEDGASAFEKWCHAVITKVFAGSLSNVELKPNRNATQRRDIVGTNIAQEDVWKWLREHYHVRQVVFEAKNYEELTFDDIRQMHGYLYGEYGTLGFVITRGHGIEPTTKENTWIKEGYRNDHRLVVKLTAKWLSGILGKLRNPEKYNVAAGALQKQLDNYHRLYLEGQGLPRSPKNAKSKKRDKGK